MDRWSGILKVPLSPGSQTFYRVGVSVCLSPTSKTLAVPSANAVFFNGDQVGGTGNPVIEKLSDLRNIAEILVLKFGASINSWVIEASAFNGPFAVYKDFIPSLNRWGEPQSYDPTGFPASRSTVSLLTSCFQEVKRVISTGQSGLRQSDVAKSHFDQPNTVILGFSKGGTVLNQLVSELGFSDFRSIGNSPVEQRNAGGCSNLEEQVELIPGTKESLHSSISEIHYVDVGLNTSGAYLNDADLIKRVSNCIVERSKRIRFVFHGTPRQWCDSRRSRIRNEKDRMASLLSSEAERSGGLLDVCERFYFANKPPNLQMHFEIIEELDVS